MLNTSIARLPPPGRTTAPRSTTPTRSGGRSSRRCGTAPASSKLTSNYTDLLFDPAANAEWCEFIAEKIRGIVDDPETAERLIPKDHRFGEKRPPFVTGYYEAFNNPNVSLVDLGETPIVRVTESGHRDDRRRARVRRHRVGDRLRLRHRRARRGWGSAAGTASRSPTHWADGPTTFLGVQTAGFPNFFFPGGPHAAAGNNPRYNGDQVDFVTDMLVYARDHGYDIDRGRSRRPRRRGPAWSTGARRATAVRDEQLLLRRATSPASRGGTC